MASRCGRTATTAAVGLQSSELHIISCEYTERGGFAVGSSHPTVIEASLRPTNTLANLVSSPSVAQSSKYMVLRAVELDRSV